MALMERLAVLMACALAPCVATAQPTERPFEEFLAAQGTYCLPDGLGGCLLLNAPLPNTLGWQSADGAYCAFVDYAGVANRYLVNATMGALDLGTTVTGRVTETAGEYGQNELTVMVSADNALVWVVEGCDLANGTVVFGHNLREVLQGATPAVGSVMLRTKLHLAIPGFGGQSLPDLFQILAYPRFGENFIDVTFTAHAASERQGSRITVMHKSVWERGAAFGGPVVAEMIIMK